MIKKTFIISDQALQSMAERIAERIQRNEKPVVKLNSKAESIEDAEIWNEANFIGIHPVANKETTAQQYFMGYPVYIDETMKEGEIKMVSHANIRTTNME